MLDLRPNCECCDHDLPPSSGQALICTFECTFCKSCAEAMGHTCKNCGGNLTERPIRPANYLATNPPLSDRFLNPHHCPETPT